MKPVNTCDIKEISNEIISQLNKAKINDFDRSLINVNEMIVYCLLRVPFEEDHHKRNEISRITMKKYNLDDAIQKYIEIYNKDLN